MSAPYFTIDSIPASVRERSDTYALTFQPETRFRLDGVDGFARGASARAQGLAQQAQKAHQDHLAVEGDLSFREVTLRAGRHEMTPEERAQWDAKLARSMREREATTAAAAAAAKIAGEARDIANRTILYTAQVAASGNALKVKRVKPFQGVPRDLLEVIREQTREERAAFERARNAPPPVAVFVEQALEQLDEIARRDWVNPSYYGGKVSLDGAVMAIDAEPAQRGGVVTIPDFMPLAMALFGNEIRKLVLDRIKRDHAGDTTFRLPEGEKALRLAKHRAELLELQHKEASLIVAVAGQDALELPFPQGMDPRAVLGVEGPPPAKDHF